MQGQLIIFDCDGVLVDSEPISINLLREHCRKSGYELTEKEAYAAFLGRPVADAHRTAFELFGYQLEPIDLVDFQIEVLDLFRRNLRPVAGIREALSRLDASLCVASSSNIQRIRESLEMTGLLRFFRTHLFSTDMVSRGKPEPDVFLYAAAMMGFEPSGTIVVEDSPAGIAAAQAAGMKCIAFCGASHASPAVLVNRLRPLNPNLLISEMEQLGDAVRALSRKKREW
jgi:HAD superfamily hydrolase (TIGR01509 family)